MEVIRGLAKAQDRLADVERTVTAIGVFDGVHLGHCRVIKNACDCAAQMQALSLVFTFDYHPEGALNSKNGPPSIASTEHKIKLIDALGVDFCVIPDFKTELSCLGPKEFIRDVLVKKLKVKAICVGHDFRFGKARAGDIDLLKQLAVGLGLKVIIADPVKAEQKIISSSLIREMIMTGDLEKAGKLLGRPVSVLGTVVKGQQRGRDFNYPTANIDPHHEALPSAGVYCIQAGYEGQMYKGLLNIGVAPTFEENENRIEVHLFDFNENIYGKDLEVIFVKKIRDEIKFSSCRDLVKQIQADEDLARKIL